jgi:hypothetical protein
MAVLMYLRSYAKTLYFAEGNLYQQQPNLEAMLQGLKRRIVVSMMKIVSDVEKSVRAQGVCLANHGLTEREMRKAVADEVETQIRARLDTPKIVDAPPLPPQVVAQMMMADGSGLLPRHVQEEIIAKAQAEALSEKANHTPVESRAALLSEYKQTTGDPPNKRIYEAANSGIHKPEFYQWLSGKLPDKSRVTKRFEAFLKARKRPIPKKPYQSS